MSWSSDSYSTNRTHVLNHPHSHFSYYDFFFFWPFFKRCCIALLIGKTMWTKRLASFRNRYESLLASFPAPSLWPEAELLSQRPAERQFASCLFVHFSSTPAHLRQCEYYQDNEMGTQDPPNVALVWMHLILVSQGRRVEFPFLRPV